MTSRRIMNPNHNYGIGVEGDRGISVIESYANEESLRSGLKQHCQKALLNQASFHELLAFYKKGKGSWLGATFERLNSLTAEVMEEVCVR